MDWRELAIQNGRARRSSQVSPKTLCYIPELLAVFAAIEIDSNYEQSFGLEHPIKVFEYDFPPLVPICSETN